MTHDDPKLTAYALGELDNAADRAAVEAFLASDETARRLVDEIRQTAATLARGLQSAEIPTLTPQQRDTIAAAKSTPAPLHYRTPDGRPRRLRVRWALATAACAAIATAGFFSIQNPRAARRQVASNLGQIGSAALMYSNENKAPAPAVTLALPPQSHVEFQTNPFLGTTRDTPLAAGRSRASAGDRSTSNLGFGRAPDNYYFETTEATVRAKAPHPDAKPAQTTWDKTVGGYIAPQGPTVSNPTPSTVNGGTLVIGGGAAPVDNFRVLTPYGQTTPGQQAAAATRSDPSVRGTDPQWAGNSVLTLDAQRGDGAVAAPAPATPDPQLSPADKLDVNQLAQQQNAQKELVAGVEALAKQPVTHSGVSTGDAANTGAPAAAVKLRKEDFVTSFGAQLQTVREASARNETEVARAALGDARKLLEERRVTLTATEWGEANAALRFTEAQVPGTESYARLADNPFQSVADAPLSTFSIDVDTASYSNVRRFIDHGQLPPADAVRIEELVNYFPYTYEAPPKDSKDPFKANVEIAACPWNNAHRLARVALKGREIAIDKRPVSNLVFLIDVSGSMNEPAKLPLVKEGLKLLVNQLNENDRISLVVYAGRAGLVLPSTPADPKNRDTILAAIDNLSAGGSTNGGQGIELAYHVATQNFIKGGTNRVLLATDGDWNVGITDQTSLTHLIESEAKSGVFLSVLGFGFGNLKDSTMEKLADKGNGHYAYIDDLKEARKVLVEEMSGTLVTIAKDVKIQIEFNPAQVSSYRLIGYENRMLKKEDFNNDKVDAGEIGAGHTVTALYEIVPATDANKAAAAYFEGIQKAATPTSAPAAAAPAATPGPDVDPLKYQKVQILNSDELLTLKLRYKQPDGDTSTLVQTPVKDSGLPYAKASDDFKFAAAVAQYGMILRNSPHKGTATLDAVLELADEGKGKDEKGYRADFLDLVKKTKSFVK